MELVPELPPSNAALLIEVEISQAMWEELVICRRLHRQCHHL